MPTLYVENIPSDLYEALRLRAKSAGRSISAEVMNLLSEHVPTPARLAGRRRIFDLARKIRQNQRGLRPPKSGKIETAEEMLRADRER
jgi:plasmid stability protein